MKNLTLSLLSTALTLWIATPPPGDLEVFFSGGSEITESWPPSVTTIPWDITYTNGVGGQFWTGHGTNAPALNGFSGALAIEDKPGVSSLIAAASSWNSTIIADQVDMDGEPDSSVTTGALTVGFSKNPTLVARTTTNFMSVNVANFQYVPITFPTICCQGSFRATSVTAIPDTIISESAFAGQTARNTVDFVNNGRYWQSVLGQSRFAMAVAAVRVLNTGEIVEFDIGFNAVSSFWDNLGTSGFCAGMVCATVAPGLNYSFLSESKVLNRVLGDPGGIQTFFLNQFNPAAPIDWPQVGFADIQGVATHEFGHALGLGHSFQAGRANLLTGGKAEPTDFPTMYPDGQVASLEQSFDYSAPAFQAPGTTVNASWTSSTLANPATWPASVPAVETNPFTRGMLGHSARSLEMDDIAAIGRGYPTATFGTLTGNIQGTVTRNGTPFQGALITASMIGESNTIRASTLSYAGGAYDLSGLPLGDYVLRVEPFPKGIINVASVWPTYIGTTQATAGDFPAEYWNVSDSANEGTAEGSSITLATAGGSQVADFVLDGNSFGSWNSPVLTLVSASATGATGVSEISAFVANRRLMTVAGAFDAASAGATSLDVTLRIDGSAAYANALVKVVAAPSTLMKIRAGLVTSLLAGTYPIATVAVTGTLDASGALTMTIPLSPKAGSYRENIEFEVYVTKPGQNVAITNSASVWFQY